MRIATWNVNSLKARLGRVEEWLAEVQPDVLCMQETKLADDAFPALTFQALGYESAHHGQGSGTASRSCPGSASTDVVANFADGEPTRRRGPPDHGDVRRRPGHVGLRPQRPGARPRPLPYKLAWLARLRAHVAATLVARRRRSIVTGDFNIAPDDRDVLRPGQAGRRHPRQPARARRARPHCATGA